MRKNINILFALLFSLMLTSCGKYVVKNEYLRIYASEEGVFIVSSDKSKEKIAKLNLPGDINNIEEIKLQDEDWGRGNTLRIKHDENRETSLSLFPNKPFAQIHTRIVNATDEDYFCERMDVASFDISLGIDAGGLKTLGSGGLKRVDEANGSFSYSALVDPESRDGAVLAWLTQYQGIGVFEPNYQPGDAMEAVHVGTFLEYGQYLVRSGEERDTDVLLFGFFDDARKGLELYADLLVEEYDIQLKEKPNVYCTWYHMKFHKDLKGSGASNEHFMMENAKFAKEQLAPFGLNVLQIDDHWQNCMLADDAGLGKGPIKTFMKSNSNYPKGMEDIAGRIKAEGFVPGIWFMPFSGDYNHEKIPRDIYAKNVDSDDVYVTNTWSGTPIDASSPQGEIFLRKRFKRIYDWGFRYFKIDGLHTGSPSKNIYINRGYEGKEIFGNARIYDEDLTFVQGFRKGLKMLNDEAPEAFLLGCTVTQNMNSFASSFGMVDAMRVGPDNYKAPEGLWRHVILGADFAGNLYFLNNKLWYNDPDPIYVRDALPYDMAKWMVSFQAVSGVMWTSSVLYSYLSEERLNMLKRSLPTHSYQAYPVDYLESVHPQIWKVDNERISLIGLFNWDESKAAKISYNLERMDLDGNEEYEVYDFWADKYWGKISKNLNASLEAGGCKVLSLKKSEDRPNLISTSRHITQGLIDVLEEKWEQNVLKGKSSMVKGDIYELRIIVPEGYSYKQVICDAEPVSIKEDGCLLKISLDPKISGAIDWSVEFLK